jgi:DNA-binding NarL/FixJ family response regulator
MTDQAGVEAAGSARILIGDDEPLNVDYLEQELEGLGFVTESAVNGLEALERVAASPPDLVLLDVMMPELDGIATLRILKQDPETRLIPVVLMTALNAVEDRVRGIEAGADDFLSKPVDDRELLARIRTAISHKRVIDEAVGELRSTSAYLHRFGRQERDVAVLAVEWRPTDDRLPASAMGFVGRREREVAEQVIAAYGGLLSEREHGGGQLVAVFDGPDPRTRAIRAVEAALAVLGGGRRDAGSGVSPQAVACASVAVGAASVGSTRTGRGRDRHWAWGADGEPVIRASTLAHEAETGSVVVSGGVAAAVSDRFVLISTGHDVYRALASANADEESARPPSDRRVTTILVTDVVGSTSTVAREGDLVGGELLAAQERLTRAELVLYGGDVINTTGDGCLAAFDSPARAIRCAFAIGARLHGLGLAIRAGVHTGELQHIDGDLRGIAIHVAARIATRAAPGEVLVSTTTRELAEGAGLAFADRGEHRLKGLSEPRQLFVVREETLGGASGSTPPTRAASRSAGLTVRELDVLRLVSTGHSDAQVAEQLYLSVRTVNAHLRAIYRKVGVRSRVAASRFAEENGLL